jgi:hypothetical protein
MKVFQFILLFVLIQPCIVNSKNLGDTLSLLYQANEKELLVIEHCELCLLTKPPKMYSNFLSSAALNKLYDSSNAVIDFNKVVHDYRKTKRILKVARKCSTKVCNRPFIRNIQTYAMPRNKGNHLGKLILECSPAQLIVLFNLQFVYFENYHIPKDSIMKSIELVKLMNGNYHSLNQRDYNKIYRIYMNAIRKRTCTTNPLRGTCYKWKITLTPR